MGSRQRAVAAPSLATGARLRHEHEFRKSGRAPSAPHCDGERGGRVRVGHELFRKLAVAAAFSRKCSPSALGERTCVDIAGEQVPLRHEQLGYARLVAERAQRPQEGRHALVSE